MFESKTLETKIEESNVGHQLLKKMGTFSFEITFYHELQLEFYANAFRIKKFIKCCSLFLQWLKISIFAAGRFAIL